MSVVRCLHGHHTNVPAGTTVRIVKCGCVVRGRTLVTGEGRCESRDQDRDEDAPPRVLLAVLGALFVVLVAGAVVILGRGPAQPAVAPVAVSDAAAQEQLRSEQLRQRHLASEEERNRLVARLASDRLASERALVEQRAESERVLVERRAESERATREAESVRQALRERQAAEERVEAAKKAVVDRAARGEAEDEHWRIKVEKCVRADRYGPLLGKNGHEIVRLTVVIDRLAVEVDDEADGRKAGGMSGVQLHVKGRELDDFRTPIASTLPGWQPVVRENSGQFFAPGFSNPKNRTGSRIDYYFVVPKGSTISLRFGSLPEIGVVR